MKKLFTAIVLGIVLAGVSLAQTSSEGNAGGRQAGKAAEVKAAVVEFSPEPNASGMPADAKRQLQTGLAAALAKSAKFDVAEMSGIRATHRRTISRTSTTVLRPPQRSSSASGSA